MIAGRYSLVREIGRGGMGAVHLARDEVLGRDVAIKRIGMIPGATAPDLARAEREARLAAMLNHPHVVAVFDLVEDQDQQWLVMEYVDGQTLAQRIRAGGPLDHATAAGVMAEVAEALLAAHRAGIVHRDVKPSNILLTSTGQAKLTDFGIARAQADASLTQTGLVTGSPAYLAPEVASGSSATEASDVWSLGATLFHVLSGRPPYDVNDNLIGGLYKIVHEEPPRLADAGAFADVLAATMTRDPARRWSMEQVRERLGAICRDPHAPAAAAAAVSPTAPAAPTTATRVLDTPDPTAEGLTPVPPAAPAPRTESAPRRHSPLPWVLAAAAVLVVGFLGWLALGAGDDQDAGTADRTPTAQPSTGGGAATPDGVDPEVARAEMTAFVEDYLALVTSDPEAAFARLTPQFQAQSNGFGGYSGFWRTIESATPRDVQADPETMTVSYTVDYVRTNGSRTTEDIRLRLVRQGGDYLISGEG